MGYVHDVETKRTWHATIFLQLLHTIDNSTYNLLCIEQLLENIIECVSQGALKMVGHSNRLLFPQVQCAPKVEQVADQSDKVADQRRCRTAGSQRGYTLLTGVWRASPFWQGGLGGLPQENLQRLVLIWGIFMPLRHQMHRNLIFKWCFLEHFCIEADGGFGGPPPRKLSKISSHLGHFHAS